MGMGNGSVEFERLSAALVRLAGDPQHDSTVARAMPQLINSRQPFSGSQIGRVPQLFQLVVVRAPLLLTAVVGYTLGSKMAED